ncbi:MAG: glutamate racemase [Proteobacteria bacterium]|nr:glutamate racemase [Pseudomonadota bacterium]
MNPSEAPKILVFDSGLGGLSVLAALREKLPGAEYFYLGDDALFPYGKLAPDVLIARVDEVIAKAMQGFAADCIVIACNTASTLVLPHLRARYSMPVVGTVPAIKPAAERTKSGLVSVLATPGTVSRDYTADLIRDFATGVDVTLVGAPRLAELAERALRGEALSDADISAEIAPAFVSAARAGEAVRTDVVVLGCTHYPLIQARIEALAPWPVEWIDPAPAIARRVAHLLGGREAPGQGEGRIALTAGRPASPALAQALIRFGLEDQVAF